MLRCDGSPEVALRRVQPAVPEQEPALVRGAGVGGGDQVFGLMLYYIMLYYSTLEINIIACYSLLYRNASYREALCHILLHRRPYIILYVCVYIYIYIYTHIHICIRP